MKYPVHTYNIKSLRNSFELHPAQVKAIWNPVFDFGDLVKYEETKVFGRTKQSESLWYLGNQTFKYSETFQYTFSCDLDFTKFPFDSHHCSMLYGSFQDNANELKLKPPTIVYYNVNTNSIKTRNFKNSIFKTSIGENPIILNELHIPFTMQIEVIQGTE